MLTAGKESQFHKKDRRMGHLELGTSQWTWQLSLEVN